MAEIHAQLKLRAVMLVYVVLGKSQKSPPLLWKEGKRGQETNIYQILTKLSSISSPKFLLFERKYYVIRNIFLENISS